MGAHDGSIVLFALNSGSASETFSVSWKGNYFNYTLPSQSAVNLGMEVSTISFLTSKTAA
jgi:Glycosyl hydrolase family 30 beta sandwich domain